MQIDLTLLTIIAVLGAIIGSFLSVCIYRIPLSKLSEDPEDQKLRIWFPSRSMCPGCKTQLLWHHNIPILSWCFLGGKCGFCKQKISPRYPFVELLSLIAAAFCYLKFGPTPTAILIYIFLASLIVITFIDLDYMIIPDVISKPGIVIGLLIGVLQQFTAPFFSYPIAQTFFDSFLGFFFGYALFRGIAELYVWLRKKEGLGLGDVKLLGMIGSFFGAQCVLFTIFVSSVLGSIIGLLVIAFSKRKFEEPLPFGPFIVLAVFIFLFLFNPETNSLILPPSLFPVSGD